MTAALSREDVAALLLRGIDDPTAVVAILSDLSEYQLRDALCEMVGLVGALVRADDRFRGETSRQLDEMPDDLDEIDGMLELGRILVRRLRTDMSLRRTLTGVIVGAS